MIDQRRPRTFIPSTYIYTVYSIHHVWNNSPAQLASPIHSPPVPTHPLPTTLQPQFSARNVDAETVEAIREVDNVLSQLAVSLRCV